MSRDISKGIKSKLSPLNCPIIEYTIIMKREINGKKLLDKLTDLGWDYQCMTKSGRETYDEIMTMFGVLEEGEQWYEV